MYRWWGWASAGWIAAEMASQSPTAYRKLVLVGAMGIKPPQGDIADQAIVSYLDYPQAGFHDQAAFTRIYGDVSTDQLEAWDIAREMVFRTAWKPYMYSQTLPHLLGGVKAPALVVWGDDDRHVPKSAGDAYVKALQNARLETVAACGHYVDMEKPDELAKLVSNFRQRELRGARHAPDVFHRTADGRLRCEGGAEIRRDRTDVLQQPL